MPFTVSYSVVVVLGVCVDNDACIWCVALMCNSVTTVSYVACTSCNQVAYHIATIAYSLVIVTSLRQLEYSVETRSFVFWSIRCGKHDARTSSRSNTYIPYESAQKCLHRCSTFDDGWEVVEFPLALSCAVTLCAAVFQEINTLIPITHCIFPHASRVRSESVSYDYFLCLWEKQLSFHFKLMWGREIFNIFFLQDWTQKYIQF